MDSESSGTHDVCKTELPVMISAALVYTLTFLKATTANTLLIDYAGQ